MATINFKRNTAAQDMVRIKFETPQPLTTESLAQQTSRRKAATKNQHYLIIEAFFRIPVINYDISLTS